ncbi:hypothetical protein J6590_053972 [Homalodisca vitripennis]|nr:hypothetical protein J6590_053972 [Homalodisca vitripennis]
MNGLERGLPENFRWLHQAEDADHRGITSAVEVPISQVTRILIQSHGNLPTTTSALESSPSHVPDIKRLHRSLLWYGVRSLFDILALPTYLPVKMSALTLPCESQPRKQLGKGRVDKGGEEGSSTGEESPKPLTGAIKAVNSQDVLRQYRRSRTGSNNE